MSNHFVAEDFTASVEQVAMPALLRGQFAMAATDVCRLAESRHADLSDTSHVACGPGCDACCVVNVAVLAPEADAIVSYLRLKLEPDALDSLRLRLESLNRHTRWLDDEERIMANHFCAFLNGEGRCIIHPVRPLLCRGMTSVNAEDCSTSKSMLALGEHHPVTICLTQKEIFDAAFVGLGQALKTCGLDGRSSRLAGAVLERLST